VLAADEVIEDWHERFGVDVTLTLRQDGIEKSPAGIVAIEEGLASSDQKNERP
jgi:hypothetical protein